MGTDRDWERWGSGDPYFGVLSETQFRGGMLTAAAKGEFFASGTQHVARVLRDAGQVFGVDSRPRTVLDFGCGVGRLLIPFARVTSHVTGVDVSPSMLDEARRNCAADGITNVTLVGSDDTLSQVHECFDLVHSYIVFQHIHWSRGRQLVRVLAQRVAPGGVLAVQVVTRSLASPAVRALVRLRYVFPPANWARNILRGRPPLEQAMQMHVYDVAALERDLGSMGFTCARVDDQRRGFASVFLFARRGA